jgi:uncharacterized delta-60 repeat protein
MSTQVQLNNQTGETSQPVNPITISSAHLINDNHDGVLSVFAQASFDGSSATITVTATNSDGLSTQQQFTAAAVTDTQVDPPFLGPITNQVTTTGTPDVFALNATDLEGAGVTYFVVDPNTGGTPNNATITIVDNDGTIQFNEATYQVSESNATALVFVRRTGDTSQLATVDYLITDGTATLGQDYNATNGTLTFAPGEVLKNISIQIINDTLVEPTETINLALTNATGGVPLGGQNTAVLSILDDDSNFQFASPSFTVNENTANAIVNVGRVGLTNFPASVTFFTTDGTATNNVDYRGTNIVLNFAPGESNKTVTIRILDDILIEGDETVNLVLTNATAGASLGTNSATTLLILDDDCSIEFTAAASSVNEFAGTAAISVRRNGGTVNPVSVNYATRDGTAVSVGPNRDFVAASGVLSFAGNQLVSTGGNLVFQPGESNKTIFVTIIDDTIGEGPETFSLILSNAVGPALGVLPGSTRLGSTTNMVVTIIDDETPGGVDTGFDPGSGANDIVRAISLQSDLKIVFGGDFTSVEGVSFNHVARLQSNGSLDTSFNPGNGADGNVLAVALQSDGKIVLGCAFGNVDGSSRPGIARLNADGNLDNGFNPGSGANNVVRAVAVQADGKIVIAGDFTSVNGAPRNRLARLNANGFVDAGFNPVFNGPVNALAIQSDGKILAAGAFTTLGGTGRNGIARLTTNGLVDATFDPGAGAASPVNAVGVQSDGKIVIGGRFTAFDNQTRNYLTRLESNGTLDVTFNPGTGPDAPLNTLLIQPNGKIIIGGDFIEFLFLTDLPPAELRAARLFSASCPCFSRNLATSRSRTCRSSEVKASWLSRMAARVRDLS